ncbi:CheR family methyltransferase [Gallaecimonas mangrovi]|uniref:CheR family methyltransferase n=1 Tax=Gallaecimonas mangrovi TaxID=2291597 RepID=UPI000E209BDA|nr:protein-glutamate O-methyltransferase CheR [Gallaecimonas mangrovi]
MITAAANRSAGYQVQLKDNEFRLLQRLFFDLVGIQLPDIKKSLVSGRLAKRLSALSLDSYMAYYQLLLSGQGQHERSIAIDLITTHETYFFREPRHFAFLEKQILPRLRPGQPFRAWSAAASTGEEAYSLAMVLDRLLPGRDWQLCGTDISEPVLAKARRGLYPMSRGEQIPAALLKRYCLKGKDRYEGCFLVNKALREKVNFQPWNLTLPAPQLGQFNLVLLRNVLIYFDADTKHKVLNNVIDRLAPGGCLMLGHSEALHESCLPLEQLASSIYRKVGTPKAP